MKKGLVSFFLFFACYAVGMDWVIKKINPGGEARKPGYFVKLAEKSHPFPTAGLSRADRAAVAFRQKRVPLPCQIDDMLVADLNKDGLSDIAVLDASTKKILTFMGNSGLTFAKKYEKKFDKMKALFAGAADYTGDKIMDLAVVDTTDNRSVSIFPGFGTGKLKTPKPVASPDSSFYDFYYAATLDLNGDGKPDILGVRLDDVVTACLNTGLGNFKSTKTSAKAGHSGLAAGDFDGDRKDDFFIADDWHDKITFFKSLGDGNFTRGKTGVVKNLGDELYAADLNADKKMDLMGAGDYNGKPWRMLGQGNGTLKGLKTLKGENTLLYGACLNDLDGDKYPDLVSAEEYGIHYYPGKAQATYDTFSILGEHLQFNRTGGYYSGARNIGVGNFNGDAKPDIVGAQYFGTSAEPSSTNLVLYLNGETPADFQISNLQITYLNFDGSTIFVNGSVGYSGSGIDLHFAPAATTPTDSAFMQIQVYIDINDFYRFYVTIQATGEFINKPGTNSGIITFSLAAPSPVRVSGDYTATTTAKYVLLWDYNLVSSNIIIL